MTDTETFAAILAAVNMVNKNVSDMEERLVELVEVKDRQFREAFEAHTRRLDDHSGRIDAVAGRIGAYDLKRERIDGRKDVVRWGVIVVNRYWRVALIALAAAGVAVGHITVMFPRL